jgi:hypothetical protein
MKWYVLQFTTTRFAAVFSHLEQHNFSYYCPMISEKYRRPDKQISFRERLLPLFPGYLFIQADFEKFTHLLSPHYLMFSGLLLLVESRYLYLMRKYLTYNKENGINLAILTPPFGGNNADG